MILNVDDILNELNHADLMHGFHYSEKYKALYVEVPKCACSSIKRKIQNYEHGVPGEGLLDIGNVHAKRKNPYALPGYAFRNVKGLMDAGFVGALTSSSVFRYSFVRNPYERLLSAYRNKLVKQGGDKIRAVNAMYGDSGLSDEEKRKLEVPFDAFIEFVLSHDDLSKMNVHWRPQVSMLAYDFLNYNFIGRVEDMNRGWRHVFDSVYSDEFEYTDLTRENSSSAKLRTNQEHLYTRDLAEKVYRFYERDFETFNYTKESYMI